MIRPAALLFIILVISCKDKPVTIKTTTTQNQPQSNTANSKTNIHEVRLGESDYFVELPDTYRISEARGKEGQLGYDIIPRDTSSTAFGIIEIIHADPILEGQIPERKKAKPYITSHLLDKQVLWKMVKTKTGYFYAFTAEKGDLDAWVLSWKINEVDSLISIISTLRRK